MALLRMRRTHPVRNVQRPDRGFTMRYIVRIAAYVSLVTALGCTSLVHAADVRKTLHVAFPVAETGFDPQASSDVYSNYVNRVIFDPLFRYDYLARPHKVIPNTAAALPEASRDGTEWTIRVKPGIHFSDDPAFKGKK